jgi:hypothetical protein
MSGNANKPSHTLHRAACIVTSILLQTIHWLRYGCLPVFVIEGRPPQAKLDTLRARLASARGLGMSAVDVVGNRAGGQFDCIGQAVRQLLEAMVRVL